jgi:hypothetical protein
MDFKLKCTFTKNLWINQDKTSFKALVCETIPGKDFTKSWAIWTKVQMLEGVEYLVEGYISESPNKGFINEQGKTAYASNFNATTVIPLDANHSFPDYDDSNLDEVPF